jgi:hypothetical protein
MAIHKEVYNHLEGIGGSLQTSSEIENILFNVILRHNEQLLDAGINTTGRSWSWRHDKFLPPHLTTPRTGNEICLEVPARSNAGQSSLNLPRWNIPLGYYSTLLDEFVIYPDLVEHEEFEVIRASADTARQDAIHGFNNSSKNGLLRIDYEPPEVFEIHSTHEKKLVSSGLMYEILNSVNCARRDTGQSTIIDFDSCTQGALCFRENVPGNNPERFIALLLFGSFITKNGKIERSTTQFTNIAELDEESDEPFSYQPVNGLVDPIDMGEITEMAIDLATSREVMAMTDGLQLDTQMLGIKRTPEA